MRPGKALLRVAGTELLRPAAEDRLRIWPVSRRVNKTGNGDGDPTLIDEVAGMIGAPADYDLTVSVPATVAEQRCGLGQEPGEAGGLNSSGTSSRNTSEWIVRIAAPMPVLTALKSKSALGPVSCRPAASRFAGFSIRWTNHQHSAPPPKCPKPHA